MESSLPLYLLLSFPLVVPLWKIYAKAGYPPALSLVLFAIPYLVLVTVAPFPRFAPTDGVAETAVLGFVLASLVLAFSRWPALERRE